MDSIKSVLRFVNPIFNMKLEDCKFKTRGDLLEAAELLDMSPEDEIKKNYEPLALMMSSLESFEPNVMWRKILRDNIDELKTTHWPRWFVTVMYTTEGPQVFIPGLEVMKADGNKVEYTSPFFESKTFHLSTLLEYIYGKQKQTGFSKKA